MHLKHAATRCNTLQHAAIANRGTLSALALGVHDSERQEGKARMSEREGEREQVSERKEEREREKEKEKEREKETEKERKIVRE